MHIRNLSENALVKKSISQNKEYHDNAKIKKLAVFRNKTFELRNRSTIHNIPWQIIPIMYTPL